MIGLRRNRPLALAAAFILFAGNLFAADIESTVDEIAAKFVGSRTPGLSIAIAKSDEVLLQKGYGLAHVEKQIPVEADTVFRTGSVTKQFTGVAIVQLSLAGKFGLDDEFTTVLKDYPATPKPITIRHLLHHTSGIPSFTGLPSYMPNMPNDVTHAELVARFSSLPLDFDPGTDWRYNNSGYYLLGMIVEAASGDRYADYLEAHLFGPAGMNHSDYETSATPRAEGYRRNGDTFSVAGPISMTQPFSAGAIASTAPDLIRWQRALVNGALDPPDAFERITSDAVDAGGGRERYGFGIGMAELGGRRVISHGGGINGFASLLAYFPESDHTFVILANTEGFNAGGVLSQLTRALLPEE